VRAGSWGKLTDDAGGLIDLTADYAPAEIAFPSLYEGERSDMLFLLHPPTDGVVSASLPPDRNFKIAAMRVYDGLISLDPARARSVVSVASGRTSGPWLMEAKAGQSVGIVVRFEPAFHIVENGAGMKSATLEVSPAAPAAKITVPVKGRFRGLSLGVIAFADEPEITIIHPDRYNPTLSYSFEAPVELVNSGDAVTGMIRPLSLPAGVTMSERAISLGAKETRVVRPHLRLDRMDHQGIWYSQFEVPHPIILEVQFGERKSQVGFYAVVYPMYLYWGFDHDVGSCDIAGHLIVFGSGNFRFFAQASNSDLVVHREVSFSGGFDGLDLINMVIIAAPNDSTTNSYGFHRQYYEDNYTGLIHRGLTLKIKVRYPA
jgi:hypothetical protein